MTVSQDDAPDAAAVRLEPAEIGVNDVDPEVPVVEGHAAVDQQDLAPLLEHEAVHPHLAQTAEGHDANSVVPLPTVRQRRGRCAQLATLARARAHSCTAATTASIPRPTGAEIGPHTSIPAGWMPTTRVAQPHARVR